MRCEVQRALTLLGVLLAGALIGACGGGEDPDRAGDGSAKRDTSQSSPGSRVHSATATPSRATPTPRVSLAPAEQCRGGIRVGDPAGDSTGRTYPGGREVSSSPAADLRRFELRADVKGVCARWTTGAPAKAGATFTLVAHGPFGRSPGGAGIAFGHGFEVELGKDDARVTYGRQVLRGRVGQSGRVVSVVLPRAELDRPPANAPDRPAFPYRTFTFEARVALSGERSPAQGEDLWPQGRSGPAAYINGRLCAAPCTDRRLGGP
jgi:hypothetical protein